MASWIACSDWFTCSSRAFKDRPLFRCTLDVNSESLRLNLDLLFCGDYSQHLDLDI